MSFAEWKSTFSKKKKKCHRDRVEKKFFDQSDQYDDSNGNFCYQPRNAFLLGGSNSNV